MKCVDHRISNLFAVITAFLIGYAFSEAHADSKKLSKSEFQDKLRALEAKTPGSTKKIEFKSGLNTILLKYKNANISLISGEKFGENSKKLPGATYISSTDWRSQNLPPKTGLFILDSKVIPLGLSSYLEKAGYVLNKNGILKNNKGELSALTVNHYVFRIESVKKSGLNNLKIDKNGPIKRYAGGLLNIFVSKAHAFNPFPPGCLSFLTVHNVRTRGFLGRCRDARAQTIFRSFGFDSSGSCSISSPITSVTHLFANVTAVGRAHFMWCPDSSTCTAGIRKNQNCSWGAVGGFTSQHGVAISEQEVTPDLFLSFSATRN